MGVLRAGPGTAEATGVELQLAGDETLHHGVVARPQDHGSTSLEAALDVSCPSAGIATTQDVVYRVD